MSNVNLERIGWQNGTLISKAKVEIDGVIYEVEPEEYSGSTPLSAENLIQMEDNTEYAINEVAENLSNSTKYSTQETVVGEWIDGKPIYRKVYTGSIAGGGASLLVPIDVQNWDEVITLKGMLKIPSKNLRTSIPGIVYDQNTLQGLQLQIIDRDSSWQSNKFYIVTPNNSFTDYKIIFEYTKTTN